MSKTKRNPFDAAIVFLTNRMTSRGEGSEREELRHAIHLLKAAGKVSKSELQYAEHLNDISRLPFVPIPTIIALLETLSKEDL